MSKKVTYGVRGMVEWHARFKSGGCYFPAEFSGGTLDGYGVRPAEYVTESSVMQWVVEHSKEYLQGRIVKLREEETGADEAARESAVADVAENSVMQLAVKTPEKRDTERVVVPSLDDAREYLASRYGTEPGKLRTKAAIAKVAEGYGIELVVE